MNFIIRINGSLEHYNGIEISKLAENCHLLMPSISRILKNLDKEKIIKRQAVDNDLRRSKIFLTELGKKLFAKVALASAERYADIEDKYGVRKLELLYELLDDLIKPIEENDT